MEALTLDGLALHSSPYTLEAFEHTPAKKLLEWARNADSDGAKLLREPRHETAEIKLRIRVDQQSTQNTALGHVGAIVDKLQEAERQSAGGRGRGLALVWTPHDSTFTGTFYVLSGEVEVPKVETGDDAGWTYKGPVITVTLTCSPFLYGAEVTTSTTTSSAALVTKVVSSVPGDVPAEARYVVSDAATQSRDFVAVGQESFYYNAATSLIVDSADMTVSGFAGTVVGAQIDAFVTTAPVAICSTAELAHKGSFRVYGRFFPGTPDVRVRLSWRQGRDQWTSNPWAAVNSDSRWDEIDMGEIKVRPALLGTQSWQGRVEVKSSALDTISLDYLLLVPTEGFGKASRTVVYETPAAFTARDEFAQSAGDLNGKTLPIGGTWATSGSTTDLAVEATGHTAQKTAVSEGGRYAIAGTTSLTNVAAQVDAKVTSTNGSASWVTAGVVVRWTDASNHLLFGVGGFGSVGMWTLTQSASGTTVLASGLYPRDSGSWHTLRVAAYTSGRVSVWAFPQSGTPVLLATTSSAALATGGTLATGKVGFVDNWPDATAATRNYDNFIAFAAADDAACFSSQSIEFRSYGDDPVLREDSTGTYWGRPPEARGGRLWLPPAGTANRSTRVAVLARRTNIEETASDNVTDSTSIAVAFKPRWLAIPRQA